ncbi:MAG: hypothetical protein C4293_03435 [Nitrospiraceae bacterium]
MIWRCVILGFLAIFADLSHGAGKAHALTGLVLLDASFATRIIDRQPVRVAGVFQLGSGEDSRLWFWINLGCTGSCEQKVIAEGHVTVFLDWYRREGNVLTKQASTTLHVKGTRWRTWGAKRVKAGEWVAVVRAEDSKWVCLKEQCHFSIEVKPRNHEKKNASAAR